MRSISKVAAVIGAVLFSSVMTGETNEPGVWEKISGGLNETYVQSVAMTSDDQLNILAGTNQGLYISSNEHYFRPLFSFPGGKANVNGIHFDQKSGLILAATDSGLYKGSRHSGKFERIFHSSDEDENRCLAVFTGEGGIYLGTQRGLFYQPDGRTAWGKVFTPLKTGPVYQILKDDRFIYFVTDKKVFRLKENDEVPDEIFTAANSRIQEMEDVEEVIQPERTVNYVSLSGESEIIVFADSGLSYSPDYGNTWQRFDLGAVPFKELNAVLPADGRCLQGDSACLKFFAATDKGVFLYESGKWTSLYKGMDAGRVNGLAVFAERLVIAATENGVYQLPLNETLAAVGQVLVRMDYDEFTERIKHEPTIREVQRLAIDYAEVHPDKIKEWRRNARNKAWVPSLDIGIDGGQSLTRADSVYGSSSSGGSHYIGPDDKSLRDDLGWDISLSWDLADVVWSTDQTTIDSRSKLMVELREDILNQVTRLYYERLRLQAEIQSAGEDWKAVFDRRMRIDELTALLDGLTGGEFSSRIKERKSTDKVTSHKTQVTSD